MAPPPFRADQIGSLLRPPALLDLRRRHAAGLLPDAELAAAEDAAIRDAVAMQERVGLKVVSDGEFRRHSYHSYFFARLGDIVPDHIPPEPPGPAGDGVRRAAQPVARIASKVRWSGPIHVGDFLQLKALTAATPKITIPGPCALHFRGGDKAILASAYTDVNAFWDDIVAAFRAELAALAAAGCRIVQMDETAFAKFGDPKVQAMLAARGEDWRRTIDLYVTQTNRVLKDLPEGLRVGIHLCRGNRAGQFHAEGSYQDVAERLFNGLDTDLFLLEYDSERSGGFAPLAEVPKGKSVVLGLVSTKSAALESEDALARRIGEAARYMPLDNLALSPQCGFASVEEGNPIPPQAQEDKLALVVNTARRVWGTA